MRVQHSPAHGLTTDHARLLNVSSRSSAPVTTTGRPNSPGDQLELSSNAHKAPPKQVNKPKRSLAGKLFRLAGWTGFALTASVGAIGGVGYLANKDALETPTVSVHLDSELFSEKQNYLESGPATPQTPGPIRDTTDLKPSGLSVKVPRSTSVEFARALRNSPEMTELIQSGIDYATGVAEESLAEYTPPTVDILLDAHAPLPTGDKAFLHIGDLELPSLGLKELQREDVPLVLRAVTDTIKTGLKFEIETLEPDPSVKGPGLQLGAVRARVGLNETMRAHGTARLDLDLEGTATREKLENLEGRSGVEELVQRLERRLEMGRQLQQQPAARGLLETALKDQEIAFDAEVDAKGRPIAEAVFRLWLVPDTTGDGRADIAITHEADLENLENLDVQIRNLQRVGSAPDSYLGGKLNQTVADSFKAGLEEAIPGVVGHLRGLALTKITEQLSKGNPYLNRQAGKALEAGYAIGREGIDIPTHSQLLPNVHLALGEVRMDPSGDLEVGLRTTGSDRLGATRDLAGRHQAQDGQVSLTLQGELLNQQLRDKTDGGAVDWNKFLTETCEKQGLRELCFGKDEQGRTVYPSLVSEGGMPAVKFSIVVKPQGAKPVDAATGVVTGVTGGLDSGAEWVQEGLSENLGVVGDVLGGILRAPTFLVDKVAGGAEAVVDNTVGLAVDGVTETITRPTIHTGVIVPLDISFKGGQLHVNPVGKGVRFTTPDTELPFDPVDLVPTRWLSHAIVNTAAGITGPATIGEQVEKIDLGVDVSPFGGEIKGVTIHSEQGQAPDFVFELDDTDKTVEWVAQQLGRRLNGPEESAPESPR